MRVFPEPNASPSHARRPVDGFSVVRAIATQPVTKVGIALTTFELVHARGRRVSGRRVLLISACLFVTGELAQWFREFQAL